MCAIEKNLRKRTWEVLDLYQKLTPTAI
jgi:hypothetical protein